MTVWNRHVNVDGSATRRLSNSRSALGPTRSTWALRDHRITIIHRHVILWIFYFIMARVPLVDETNRYGRSKPNWLDIDRDELLTFLGLITMMGIKKVTKNRKLLECKP